MFFFSRVLAAWQAVILLVGCGSPEGRPADEISRPVQVTDINGDLTLSALEADFLSIDDDRRRAVLMSPSSVRSVELQVPLDRPVLQFAYGRQDTPPPDCEVDHHVALYIRTATEGGHREQVYEDHITDRQPRWYDGRVDLAAWEGQRVELVFQSVVDLPDQAGCAAPATVMGDLRVVSGSADPVRPDIWVVVVDALRADHASGDAPGRPPTPALDRLAAASYRFDDALSPSSWTRDSVFSMMTGTYVAVASNRTRDNEAAILPSRLPTVAERLRDVGYRTWAGYSNAVLFTGGGFERGFASYTYDPEDDGLFGLARRHLAARDDRVPMFGYLHLMAPHVPYRRHDGLTDACAERAGLAAGGPVEFDATDRLRLGPLSAEERSRVAAYYCGEVALTDRLMEELLEVIDGAAASRPTWVVFTSDHGEELWDHGGFEHGHSFHQEVVRVPLWFRPPADHAGAAAGNALEQPVSLIDVGPTLVDFAGAEPLDSAAGLSLAHLLRGEPSQVQASRARLSMGVLYGPPQFATIRDGRKRILRQPSDPDRPPSCSGFDLRTDPLEQTPLPADATEVGDCQREWVTFQQLALTGSLALRAWLRPEPGTPARLTVWNSGSVLLRDVQPASAEVAVRRHADLDRVDVLVTADRPVSVRLQLDGLVEEAAHLRLALDLGRGKALDVQWQDGTHVQGDEAQLPLPWTRWSMIEWPDALPEDRDAILGWDLPTRNTPLVPFEGNLPEGRLQALGYVE